MNNTNLKVSGLKPVIMAIAGNLFVSSIKLIAAITSGSSVIFSESVHSFADTCNQILLLIGIKKSQKLPDQKFAFGYGRERFIWALISACGIFFLGAGVTIYKSLLALLNPEEAHFEIWIFGILIAALMVEGWTFLIAIKELKNAQPRKTWLMRFKSGDPATLAVVLEDGIAVFGVLLAIVALFLTKITNNPCFDALGSLLVGILLAIMAVVLIIKNRFLLIGETLSSETKEGIIDVLESDLLVEKVLNFKSVILDVGVYRINCEIEINGNMLFKKIQEQEELSIQFKEVKDDYEEFKKFCVDYADRIPRLLGRKIDDWEKTLKEKYPELKYIDIEIN